MVLLLLLFYFLVCFVLLPFLQYFTFSRSSIDFNKTVDRAKAIAAVQSWCEPNSSLSPLSPSSLFASFLLRESIKKHQEWTSLSSLPPSSLAALTSPVFTQALLEVLQNHPSLGGVMVLVLEMINKEVAREVEKKWKEAGLVVMFDIRAFVPSLATHYLSEQPFFSEVCKHVRRSERDIKVAFRSARPSIRQARGRVLEIKRRSQRSITSTERELSTGYQRLQRTVSEQVLIHNHTRS
jgi:hypothetical protein